MNLDELESKSIYIIREAYNKFGNDMALLWSIGKDSTTLLYLCKKAFFGKIPFPVIHIDTTFKFPEMYNFRDKLVNEWDLNLIIGINEDAINLGINYDNNDVFTCCHELKTRALQKTIEKHKLKALIVGIRRDENGIRGKERYFSPRDKDGKWNVVKEKEKKDSGDINLTAMQDAEFDSWGIYATDFGENTNHLRIHPLLHWTEFDVWRYIDRENIPINRLYFSKDGKRYRSLGCMPITKPIESNATTIKEIIEELEKTKIPERSGRDMDKENVYNMQKLRSLGYM